MNFVQLSQELQNSNSIVASFKHNKSKENDYKHINAIKPYISKDKNSKKENISSNHLKNVLSIQHSRSKSKKHDYSIRPLIQTSHINNKQLGDIYRQLVSLKSQYHSLKKSYNQLLKEKEKQKDKKLTKRNLQKSVRSLSKIQNSFQLAEKEEIFQLRSLLNITNRQKQALTKANLNFQSEISILRQRLKQKSDCAQSEITKRCKLQQTLQQKQLMIAFLRSQLSNNNISINTSNVNQINPVSNVNNNINGLFFQNTVPTSNCSPDFQRNLFNENNLSLRQSHLNENNKNDKNRLQIQDLDYSRNKNLSLWSNIHTNVKNQSLILNQSQIPSSQNKEQLEGAFIEKKRKSGQKINISKQIQKNHIENIINNINNNSHKVNQFKNKNYNNIKGLNEKKKDKKQGYFKKNSKKQKQKQKETAKIKENHEHESQRKINQKQVKQKQIKIIDGSVKIRGLQRKSVEQDSLSFSRDRQRQFQSVHSLLSNAQNQENDHTILSFTKKDVIILQQQGLEQFQQKQKRYKSQLEQHQQCDQQQEGQNSLQNYQQRTSSVVHKYNLSNINQSDININDTDECLTFQNRGYIQDFNCVLQQQKQEKTNNHKSQKNINHNYNKKSKNKKSQSSAQRPWKAQSKQNFSQIQYKKLKSNKKTALKKKKQK